MITIATITCAAVVVAILALDYRRVLRLRSHYRIARLRDEAQEKYPGMALVDAYDLLYRDYHDRTLVARGRDEDVLPLIKSRQLIAQERARLIVRAAMQEDAESFENEYQQQKGSAMTKSEIAIDRAKRDGIRDARAGNLRAPGKHGYRPGSLTEFNYISCYDREKARSTQKSNQTTEAHQ
jgi:hypothetical protein